MCEALGLGGYNKVYVAEQAHIKILFSTYVELHGPALFQEGSTEDPLNVQCMGYYYKDKRGLDIREILRTTPNYFPISVKFRPISKRIINLKEKKSMHVVKSKP
jgi:hypothetical protein